MRFPLYAIAAFVVANASVYAAAPDLPPRQSRTVPLLVAFPGQAELPTLSQILTLNATNGTFLPLHNIQGDILVGMKKQKERFVFFKINNAAQFKSTLKNYIPARITSTATLIGPHTQQPLAFVNLAFSNTGLHTLGITDNLGDQQFSSGQFADAENLGDDLSQWATPFTGAGIHGVFLIGSDQDAYLDQYSDEISSTFGSSISQLVSLSGSVRPGNQAGHEHFGFLDGISQPAVSGWALRALPGQSIVPTGVILTGHVGDTTRRPAWARDGTFMAFRHLQEKVPEFNAWTLANALNASSAGNLTQEQGAELLGARMFGRWKSGAPLPLAPTQDDPELGADPERNNVYSYVNTAFDQTKCPFSAHARKTNPRSDQPLFSIANHAIRSSITYGPETSSEELASGKSAEDRGVLFVEYQSDIGNGFRFQQINWANTANFPPFKPTTPGIDPIIGRGTPPTTGGLDPLNQTKIYTVPPFVIPKGGEYFFMPSISALTGTIAN